MSFCLKRLVSRTKLREASGTKVMGKNDECENDGGVVSGDETNYHCSSLRLRRSYHVEEAGWLFYVV